MDGSEPLPSVPKKCTFLISSFLSHSDVLISLAKARTPNDATC